MSACHKSHLLPFALFTLAGLLCAFSSQVCAESDFATQKWQYQQACTLRATDLVRLTLPLETLTNLKQDLSDLRLSGPDGKLVNFGIVTPDILPNSADIVHKPQLQSTLNNKHFRIGFSIVPTTNPLTLEIETPTSQFLKSVSLYSKVIDANGEEGWQELHKNVVIFREAGKEHLSLEIAANNSNQFALELDNSDSEVLPISGVTLYEHRTTSLLRSEINNLTFSVKEEASDTLVDITLPSANLFLDAIFLDSPSHTFDTRVTATVSGVANQELAAHTVGDIRLQRTLTSDTALEVPIKAQRYPQHIQLRLKNSLGTLSISNIKARVIPTYLVFSSAQSGNYILWSAGSDSLSNESLTNTEIYRQASDFFSRSTEVTPSCEKAQANPNFKLTDPLPETVLGGSIDTAQWNYRKAFQLSNPGLYYLALDAETLALANPRLNDLRIVSDHKQVPYLIEHTGRLLELKADLSQASDKSKPDITSITLNSRYAKLPIQKLSCQSEDALFSRRVTLIDQDRSKNANRGKRILRSSIWQKSTSSTSQILEFELPRYALSTDGLTLEIENGDNAPLNVQGCSFWYEEVFLRFKTVSADGLNLYFGNAKSSSANYDLTLMRESLRNFPAQKAGLGSIETLSNKDQQFELLTLISKSNILFWLVLVGVVAVLLFAIYKVLPKAED